MPRSGIRPKTLEKYRRIKDAYEAGYSTANEIVEHLGIPRTTVYRGLQHFDIRPERDAVKRNREVYELHLAGLRPKDIAEKTGYDTTHVYYILNLFDEHGERHRKPYHAEPYELPVAKLDPLWIAEFRGFFYGEGWIGLANRAGGYAPRMNINIRADDAAALEDIRAHLGGYCIPMRKKRDPGKNSHPQVRWALCGWPRCRAVIEVTALADGLIPAKKRRDIALAYEAILARYKMPFLPNPSDYAVLHSYYLRLIEIKRFSC